MKFIAKKAYAEYLVSEHWQSLREQAFERFGAKCFHCSSLTRIQVHHIRYGHDWYLLTVDDVRPLCHKCHEAEHGIGKRKKNKNRKRIRATLKRIANLEKTYGIR